MVDKIKIRADLRSKEDKSNKVTSLSSTSTDSQYPSAKAVYDTIQGLDTGGVGINDYYFDTTTKEIVLDYERSNGGSGGGSYVDIVTEWEQNPSDEKVASEKLTKDSLDLKADSTHTHSQYLTEHQSLADYVQKSQTSGLLKNDGSVDSNSYSLSSHNHTGTYANSSHTHTKSQITDFPTIPSASSTTPSADTTSGSVGNGTTWARSNHTHPKSSIYAEATHSHTSSQITDLSVPTASTTVPSADTTSGSYGSGTSYARSNHTHPKSSIYASSTHSHNYSDVNNVTVVDVVVTYTDNSTETIKILKYTGT